MLEGILEETVSRVQRRSNARTELQNTFVRLDNFINVSPPSFRTLTTRSIAEYN